MRKNRKKRKKGIILGLELSTFTVGLETLCDEVDKPLFVASTKITIGDGNTKRFWDSTWIEGRWIKDLMPLVYATSKKKGKSLRQGKENDAWIDDLDLEANSTISVDHISQLLTLYTAMQGIQLNEDPDQITWKFTSHGQY